MRLSGVVARHLPSLFAAFGLIAGVAATPLPLPAQNRGQYIPGVTGLDAGVQLPPGFTAGLSYLYYNADKLKNADGDEVPIAVDYGLQGEELLLGYTTPWKIFGATYGASVVLFWIRGSLGLERFDVEFNESGFDDTYFEPINLGWALKQADLKFAYGFIAPTGADNVTTDFWGHDVTVAATIYLDEHKLSQVSLSSVTEFHHRKRDTDLTVGDNTTFEFAVGRLIPMKKDKSQVLAFGISGYGEWQFTDDEGTTTIPALAEQSDRVWALGPELDYYLPKLEWSALARLTFEFGARSRGEGYTFFGGIAKTF